MKNYKLSLFSPSHVRKLENASHAFQHITRAQITSSVPEDNPKIWRNDPLGTGLKSTQQVPLDWTKFENHTFFNSAESKVNVAFQKIINFFPFDGSKGELHEFMDELTGYEKHVFDKFPKFVGKLFFVPASQHYVASQDKTGYLFPDLSRNVLGQRVVGAGVNSGGSTIEFYLNLPTGSTYDNFTIFQKLETANNHGISIFASRSLNTAPSGKVIFAITSGSNSILTCSLNLAKNDDQHLAFVFDNSSSRTMKIYKGDQLVSYSENYEFGNLDFLSSSFYIGSGSSHSIFSSGSQNISTATSDVNFIPKQTMTGTLDEFRIWNSVRSQGQIKQFKSRNVFQSGDLSVYYRFNEPTGSYTNNSICLDHSGNGLHGQIQNFSTAIRKSPGGFSELTYERSSENPVLFPDEHHLEHVNSDLLISASRYDANNPNLITKLMPAHYFLEGQALEGFEDDAGNLGEAYTYNESFPGGGKMPASQVLAGFLFIWASFFDEVKVYIDAFSKLRTVDHLTSDTIPDQFLQSLAHQYGIELPNAYTNLTPSQYNDAENLQVSAGVSSYSLRQVQTLLWRRLLAEMPEWRRSKGTIHSVKSLMRSIGINPDNSFRIREYGGRRNIQYELNRKEVRKVIPYIDFSLGTVIPSGSAGNEYGFGPESGAKPAGSPFMTSSNLMVFRHEAGHPFGAPSGPSTVYQYGDIFFTVGGVAPSQTLLTSASWAYEGHYKLPKSGSGIQSLFRLETSGSIAGNKPYHDSSSTKGFAGKAVAANSSPHIFLNLQAVTGSGLSDSQSLVKFAFSLDRTKNSTPTLVMSQSIPVFDGNFWHFNVNHLAGPISSSFSVCATRTTGRFIDQRHSFSGSYANVHTASNPMTFPASGSGDTHKVWMAIGSSSQYSLGYLNQAGNTLGATTFEGRLAAPRLWSKELTNKESKEHALNPFSVGVHKPLVNFNFIRAADGTTIEDKADAVPSASLPLNSWGRLRFRSDLNQPVTSSNAAGLFEVVDQSQNGFTLTGHGFSPNKRILNGEFMNYSIFDPSFDIPTNINKVRIRSVQDLELADEINAETQPVYELDPREYVSDDRRFSIEASLVQALNEDIVNMFADADLLNEILGAPEQMFGVNYPALDRLSDKYFNRLTNKINYKEFFEFFKWFDDNFSTLIEKLIPRTTNFLGVNFVIESHILERHRFEYKQADVHIDLKDRLAARIEPFFEGKIRVDNQ